ncbi:hypothetical protein GPJ56_000773 [Histomonas meleagridis]|uniref:uncharacterized protein n=1 Tax=Histomonas meleagridis TaxID=135588 RepID=UPI00355A07D7|nr:hypothetical protein GPJ56_000773 [Histomonas meleagridis]KAH0804468.1 hypothetical protein GO595_003298 [Histomonas meleagridis]
MFGRACAVMKASDDEGVDTRYGNPIFNQDLLNLKFDEISEIDVKSNAAISKSIKMHFNEHKMQLKNASPMRQKLIDSRCKYLSALQITNESYTEVPIPSGFSFSYSLSEPPINYIDFHIILALISNIENISQSLRIGDEIKIALNSFQQLLECALDFTSKFGFICGENDLLFMCVTHRIARTLYEVLNINNIKFMIFTKFFKEKKVFLEEIFDEVAITLATQIDNGGVFAKELLHYRELACVLEMNAFASMVQMECEMIYNDGKYVKKHLMRAARAYLPFGDLYEVKFVFDEKGNFVIESKEINDVIEEKPLFPVFNMFGGFTTDENGFLSGVTW